MKHELERKDRLIDMLNARVDVQARYITQLEHKLAERDSEPERSILIDSSASAAKAGAR